MEVRYLDSSEKKRCRSLWEEAFPEDSASFVDYYMEEKTKDNRILVLEENGRILSMLHRNPYEVYAGDKAVEMRLYRRRCHSRGWAAKRIYAQAYGAGAGGYESRGDALFFSYARGKRDLSSFWFYFYF